MGEDKAYLYIEEINARLDELVKTLHSEIDHHLVSDFGDTNTIKRMAVERSAIKRVKTILNNLLEEGANDGKI